MSIESAVHQLYCSFYSGDYYEDAMIWLSKSSEWHSYRRRSTCDANGDIIDKYTGAKIINRWYLFICGVIDLLNQSTSIERLTSKYKFIREWKNEY